MIREVSRIAALAAAILATGVLPAAEEVLYWMVDDTATVNGQNVREFLPAETADSWYAARIRVTDGDIGGRDVFLDLYDLDGTLLPDSGELGIAFGATESGYWGAGVPTGNQSSIGDYAAGTPEYSFTVEIGNVTWDESSGTASWVETLAKSETRSYTSLYEAQHISNTFSMNPQAGMVAWTPTTYTVPEPSGGLLLLIGGALLALRRNKRGQ